MKEKLIEVKIRFDRLKAESNERGQIILLAYKRAKTDRVPAGVAEFGYADVIDIGCEQGLVMLGALFTVGKVGEVYRFGDVEDGFCFGEPVHKLNYIMTGTEIAFFTGQITRR